MRSFTGNTTNTFCSVKNGYWKNLRFNHADTAHRTSRNITGRNKIHKIARFVHLLFHKNVGKSFCLIHQPILENTDIQILFRSLKKNIYIYTAAPLFLPQSVLPYSQHHFILFLFF